MSFSNPIPRDTRERFLTVGAGQTVFGPFDFKVYDPLDVVVRWRATAEDAWVDLSGCTIELLGAEPSFFTITKAGLTEGTLLRVVGQRLHERVTDVTRQGVISSKALELQLDQMTVVLQEQTRDRFVVDQALASVYVALEAANEALANVETAIANGPVLTVNARHGIVTLDASDVGLENADNTSDAQKAASGPIRDAIDAAQAVVMTEIANFDAAPLKKYFIIPDADWTAALGRAISYLQNGDGAGNGGKGGYVDCHAGDLVVSGLTTITPIKPVYLRGRGVGATILRQTAAALGALFFNYAALSPHGGVFDMTIEAGAGYVTSGKTFMGTGSTDTALKVYRANNSFHVRNLEINNFARSARYEGCWNNTCVSFDFKYHQDEGILIGGDGAVPAGGGNKFISGNISNTGFTGTNTNSAGLRIRRSGGDWFDDLDITSQGNPVKVDPPAGGQIAYCFFFAVSADSGLYDNWRIDGTLGDIVACATEGCWGCFSAGGNGFYAAGTGVKGWANSGMRLRENAQRGASVSSGAEVSWADPEVAQNSQSSAYTYPGMLLDSPYVSVVGGRVGNFASGLPARQGDGIELGANVTRYRVIGVDMTLDAGQISAGKKPLRLTTTSTNGILANNLPLSSGCNRTNIPSLFSNSRGTIAAATTAYLGVGAYSTDEIEVRAMIGRACLLTQVTIGVTVAPGAGKNFTYAAMKNGSATSMTGVINGTGTFVLTLAGGVQYSPGDNYSLRVATDTGAAVSAHAATFYFDQ